MPSTHTPTQQTTTTTPTAATRGQRVQLAAYTADTGTRVLIGQRIDGIVHVFDEPAAGTDGTAYEVEAGLESKAALDALVTDYLRKAKRLGWPPMHSFWI